MNSTQSTQSTQTTRNSTTVRIMVPAGAAIRGPYGVLTAKAAFEVDAEEVRGVLTDGGYNVILRGVISYVYTRGDNTYTVSALQAHPVAASEPTSEPEQPTACSTTTRTSREGQRNARAEMAYRSLRYLGVGKTSAAPQYAALNDHTESWLCASQTQRVHPCDYLVTHDMVTGNTHCSCTAGVYGHDCVHQAAVRRAVDDRRAEMASYEMLYGEYTTW